jgi:hypothetical protein
MPELLQSLCHLASVLSIYHAFGVPRQQTVIFRNRNALFPLTPKVEGRRDSIVSILTTLQDGRVSIPGRRKRFFFLDSVRIASGAHPASCIMSKGAPSSMVQRPEYEADHSPPYVAEV